MAKGHGVQRDFGCYAPFICTPFIIVVFLEPCPDVEILFLLIGVMSETDHSLSGGVEYEGGPCLISKGGTQVTRCLFPLPSALCLLLNPNQIVFYPLQLVVVERLGILLAFAWILLAFAWILLVSSLDPGSSWILPDPGSWILLDPPGSSWILPDPGSSFWNEADEGAAFVEVHWM